MDFSMDQEQYEALIALARRGTTTDQEKRELDSFLASIEKANGVVRYKLWVQWQEADAPLPPTAQFPDTWPPELRRYIEFISRPVARTDVDQLLRVFAKNPVNVLVTPDPAAKVGWTKLADFFLS
jgi:hypothetical protein